MDKADGGDRGAGLQSFFAQKHALFECCLRPLPPCPAFQRCCYLSCVRLDPGLPCPFGHKPSEELAASDDFFLLDHTLWVLPHAAHLSRAIILP